MILTCPECSTNYMSKDGSIGPNGRSVRCARCETVWFVEGVDPDALALEDNQAVLMTAEPEPVQNAEFALAPKIAAPASIGAHVLLRDKADAEKLSKRKRAIMRIWTVPVTILLVGAIIGVLNRQAIVKKFPKTATLYQSIGMDVKANGLDVVGLTSEPLIIDGQAVLRVTGEVVNLTSQAIAAPLIQLRLENRSGEPLADWYIEVGTIGGGERVNVETDYVAPPIDGVELRYRFAPEGE